MKYLITLLFLILSCQNPEEIVQKYPSGSPKRVVRKNNAGAIVYLKEYYVNNIRKFEVEMLDGERHGSYQEWNSEGSLNWIGQYVKGEKDGLWNSWYSKNQKESEGLFKKGKKDGKWVVFWPNGKVKEQRDYDLGEQVGEEERYSLEGVLMVRHNCYPAGIYRQWNCEGVLTKEYGCKGDVKTGFYKEYDDEGSLMFEGYYQAGQKHGSQKFYHKDGWLRRLESFEKGLRTGLQIHLKSVDDTLMNVNLVKGNGILLYGNSEDFYPDTPFVRGLIHGEVVTIQGDRKTVDSFDQGKLFQSSFFGLEEGEDSYLISKGGFLDGKKNGEWLVFQKKGKALKEKLKYKEGDLFGEQLYYDSTGQLMMRKMYEGKNKAVLVEVYQK